MTSEHQLSPGNEYSTQTQNKMRLPHLDFLYRLEAEMSNTDLNIGAPFASGSRRVIMNILGGTIRGPGLEGIILEHGGADWGISVDGTDFMRLDARYTLRMSNDEHIYVKAQGIFHPGPHGATREGNYTQDEVEWFTSVQLEADGKGDYNWLNSLAVVSVLSMVDSRIFIDAYRLTNFPGVKPMGILPRGKDN